MRNDYSGKVTQLHTWPPEHMRRTLPSRQAVANYVPSWRDGVIDFAARQQKRRMEAARRRTDGPEAA